MVTESKKCWVPFKYENLPGFYFGCGRLGHSLRDCCIVTEKIENLPEDEVPFSLALKAELNFVGKVALSLSLARKKRMEQCSYLEEKESRVSTIDDGKPVIPRSATEEGISGGKCSGRKEMFELEDVLLEDVDFKIRIRVKS
ncbi:hypothetical protein V6Z11_A07G224400 [Gossypium hirsutum]